MLQIFMHQIGYNHTLPDLGKDNKRKELYLWGSSISSFALDELDLTDLSERSCFSIKARSRSTLSPTPRFFLRNPRAACLTSFTEKATLLPRPRLESWDGFSGVGVENWSSDGTWLFALIGVPEEKDRVFLIGGEEIGSWEEALIGSIALCGWRNWDRLELSKEVWFGS